jgi:hypothetical protein
MRGISRDSAAAAGGRQRHGVRHLHAQPVERGAGGGRRR